MRIAYFVHDLTDPAVGRRVRMLRAAGAEVAVVGFRRGDPVADIDGAPAFDLGRTYDAKLLQRALKVMQRRSSLGAAGVAVRDADVFLARNLEMLAVACAAQRRSAPNATIVYECLDVHRLMLSESIAGRALRLVERHLMRKARLLIVSSPAFVSHYFTPRQCVVSSGHRPVLVVENKVLDLAPQTAGDDRPPPPPGPPWRIGWFGMIRCRKSLDILCDLVRRNPGLVEVVIRGRPALTAFDDFERQVGATPGIVFGGPYRPSELQAFYNDVHFNWSIDYFEEGANSALLLPNRIYEGSRYGAVPIALAQTETGEWLKRHGIGWRLDSPRDELSGALQGLTPDAYRGLRAEIQAQPPRTFVADLEDCRALLRALELAAGARQIGVGAALPAAAERLGTFNKV